jgi:hypothetical protein
MMAVVVVFFQLRKYVLEVVMMLQRDARSMLVVFVMRSSAKLEEEHGVGMLNVDAKFLCRF